MKSGENHNYSFVSPEPSLNIIDLKPGQNGPEVLWSLARSSHLDALTPTPSFLRSTPKISPGPLEEAPPGIVHGLGQNHSH